MIGTLVADGASGGVDLFSIVTSGRSPTPDEWPPIGASVQSENFQMQKRLASLERQITHIREQMDNLEPLQDQIKILRLGQEALFNQKADKIDIGEYPRVPLIILNVPLDKRFTENMKEELINLYLIHVRQGFDDIRVVILWVMEHDFGPYASPVAVEYALKYGPHRFRRFADFFHQFRIEYYKARDVEEGHPVNRRDQDELDGLNDAIIKYFVRHLPQIREKLGSLGFVGKSWNALTLPEAIEWMMTSDNEYRKASDAVAHENEPASVVEAVTSLMNGVDDDAVRTYFSAGKDVYPSVYEFVNTVIRNNYVVVSYY